MSRDVPTAIDLKLDDAFIRPVVFVELDFDTDPVYLHTDLGEIPTLGETWSGVGGLGGISAVEETSDKVPAVKLRLDITDESAGSIFQELTQQDFYQRECIIYMSLRDTVLGDLVDSPFELWRGKCDIPEFHDGIEKYVELLVESEWASGRLSNGKLYSDAQQQQDFTGDLFFEFLNDLVNKRITWGDNRPAEFGGGYDAGSTDAPENIRRQVPFNPYRDVR